MEKLRAYLEDGFTDSEQDKDDKSAPKKESSIVTQKNIELAKMYEDAAEYESELESFEKELEIINANKLENIKQALQAETQDEDRDYAKELKNIVEVGWSNYIEIDGSHPKEQLELIKNSDFSDILTNLNAKYPDYEGSFEEDIRTVLVKRWKMLIEIKKEHIKEEIADIKIAGLKPSFVKRIYKQVHGLK